ncbi:MAG: hydroxymethylglutaryl-CoA lyase, partial [Bacteroidetes bacterium]|nr:hydroxymethylglutaryl-CoA lyase [Bacteroidota bacterium]
SEKTSIKNLMGTLVKNLPGIELGVHLHSHPNNWQEKMEAAFEAGCRRFDGAIKGFGGCPMAKDDLVGNMATENIVQFLESRGSALALNKTLFAQAQQKAIEIMS